MAFKETVEFSINQDVKSVSGGTIFFRRVEYVLNIINQMCIGFITIYMAWLCIRNNLIDTPLHAFLVTIGFILLMSEAIMCHYDNNVLTMSYKRKTKTTIHWVLQLLGGFCGSAGAIYQLVRLQFPLHSLHGKLGFATLIICLFTMLTGLVALMSGPLRRILSPLLNKTFHNFMGITTFVLALVTQFYGYKKHLITRNVPIDFEILLQVLTMVTLGLTCIGPIQALLRKLTNMCKRD